MWAQYVLGAAAVVTALGVLWSKVIRPGAKVISAAEQAAPVLRELTAAFAGSPGALNVLEEIASQFRTDSGSTLRDVVNSIATAAEKALEVSDILASRLELDRALAKQDREQIALLLRDLDRLGEKLKIASAAIQGIGVEQVSVAGDLAESHRRASEVVNEPPGAAADAAVIPESD